MSMLLIYFDFALIVEFHFIVHAFY